LAAEQFQQADVAWEARRRAQQQAVLERDLEQAEKIQSGLIPMDAKVEGLEIGIGFIPCRWVGGDYVDIVQMPDGRMFITICDVCGKGMQAALVTACLHTLVHMNATTDLTLAQIMERMNEYLVDHLPDESFATGIGMILDSATGEFIYCNAGHPPAMIAQSTGEVRHLASAENPPLGYVPVEFSTQEGVLAKGELLALFTDGYTELNNENKEMLGIEGIDDCLKKVYTGGDQVAVHDMKSQFKDQLHAFQGTALAMDDLTFIVIRRA
jgi:serine phosphatase RsbU (regulator of sigma subunit)